MFLRAPQKSAAPLPAPAPATAEPDPLAPEEDEQRHNWLTGNEDGWSGGREVAPAVRGRDNW